MSKLIVNDWPDNRCFGCSPHNESGLRLTFVETTPGSVEKRSILEDWPLSPEVLQ